MAMKWTQAARAAAFSVVAFAGAAFAGTPQGLPGVGWTVEVPDGFTLSSRVPPGFENKDGIMINMMETPPQDLSNLPHPNPGEAMNKGAPNEGVLDSFEALSVNGRDGFLLKSHFVKTNVQVLTLMVEGTTSNGTLVAVLPPNASSTDQLAALRQALLSAKENPLTEAQRLEPMPFTVQDTQGLRLVGTVANSIAVFTSGVKNDVENAPDQATVYVSLARSDQMNLTFEEFLAVNEKQNLLAGILQYQFPGAVMTKQGRRDTPFGPVLEGEYTRTLPTSGQKLEGRLWLTPRKGQLLMLYSNHPAGNADLTAKVDGLMNSVVLK